MVRLTGDLLPTHLDSSLSLLHSSLTRLVGVLSMAGGTSRALIRESRSDALGYSRGSQLVSFSSCSCLPVLILLLGKAGLLLLLIMYTAWLAALVLLPLCW